MFSQANKADRIARSSLASSKRAAERAAKWSANGTGSTVPASAPILYSAPEHYRGSRSAADMPEPNLWVTVPGKQGMLWG